jgi:hypothetical protein
MESSQNGLLMRTVAFTADDLRGRCASMRTQVTKFLKD